MPITEHKPVIDSLRLSPEEKLLIARTLDQEDEKSGKAGGRKSARFSYRGAGSIRVHFEYADGRVGDFLVQPRNISSTGVSFLHGVYVYKGTRCTSHLKTLDNQEIAAAGAVVRSSHVGGRVHEVGVAFDAEIDVARFVRVPPEGSVPATHDPANAQPAVAASRSPRHPAGKVLVVDDDPICRAIVRNALRMAGCEGREAHNARQALAVLASDEPISLMILDVVMPDLDGLSLLQYLRQQPWAAHLPVILCSMLDDPAAQEKAAQLNITAQIPKPIEVKALARKVQEIIRAIPSPVRSVDAAIKRLAMDVATYCEMLRNLADQTIEALGPFDMPAAQEDLPQAAAHLMGRSGAARNLGADRLAEALVQMARNHQQDAATAKAMAAMVRREVAALRHTIESIRGDAASPDAAPPGEQPSAST